MATRRKSFDPDYKSPDTTDALSRSLICAMNKLVDTDK